MKLLASLGFLLCVAAQAQSSPKDIQAQLAKQFDGRVAIVRDRSTNSELHYDALGHVQGSPRRGFGPIDASFYISRVLLKGSVLEIDGNTAIPLWDNVADSVIWHSLPAKRTIKADASQVSDVAGAERLMASILQNPNEFSGTSCTAEEKERFKKTAREHVGISYTISAKPETRPKDTPADSLAEVPRMCFPTGEVAFTVRKGVLAPKAKHTPDPNYTTVGLRGHVVGKVDLMFIVDEAGAATSVLMLGKPLGAGLDEQTLSAMRSWRFDPATYQGKPVPVALFIEFHFELRR